MAVVYEISVVPVTFAAPNDLVEISVPSRRELRKFIMVGMLPGTIVNIYNRLLAQTVNIVSVSPGTGGFCRVVVSAEFLANVEDTITIAGSDVAAYNTTHVVTSREYPANAITTNVAFITTGAAVGTAAYNFNTSSPVKSPLFLVAGPFDADGSGVISQLYEETGPMFLNQDPGERNSASARRKIYLKCDKAGTFYVTLGLSIS